LMMGMDSSFGNYFPRLYHNNDIFMIHELVLKSSSPSGCHEIKKEIIL